MKIDFIFPYCLLLFVIIINKSVYSILIIKYYLIHIFLGTVAIICKNILLPFKYLEIFLYSN